MSHDSYARVEKGENMQKYRFFLSGKIRQPDILVFNFAPAVANNTVEILFGQRVPFSAIKCKAEIYCRNWLFPEKKIWNWKQKIQIFWQIWTFSNSNILTLINLIKLNYVN